MSLRTTTVSSSFSSIQAFQAYFRDHDELVVPGNQPLEIKNISILTKQEDDPLEAKEILPEELSQLIIYLLRKMVVPLAKTVDIKFDGIERNLGFNIHEHFSLTPSVGMTIKTQKDPLYVRLTDLFKLMIAFSIPKVEFAPHQKLILLGITEAECALETTVGAAISNILEPRIPAGHETSIKFEGPGNNCQVSNGWATYGSSIPQRTFTVQSSHGWALTLCESKNFLFSTDGFRRRMKIKGQWKIPPNQILRIEDGLFARLQDEYPRAQFAGRDFGEFALNQILLPLGKTIKFIEHGTRGHALKWSDDFLEISSPDGFTLETGLGDLCTTLTHLGQFLIENHLSSLVLQPQQRLFIYGLTEIQVKQLDTWIESQDWKIIEPGLLNFLMPYNPVGFVWEVKWFKDFYKALASSKQYGDNFGLMMQSSEKLELNLLRASGEWLALNLINNSSPALLQDILDADEKAFIYILFKAIFYHCCDDFRHFRTDELPSFFKKPTQLKLVDLLKNNVDFTESLRLVIKNLEMHQPLAKILGSSPEEFSQLNLEKLPSPLRTIMNAMMKLVYEELQGSPFIAQCVQIIAKGLADGRFKNFIRPPAPAKASSTQSTSQSGENVAHASDSTNSITAPAEKPPEIPPSENTGPPQSTTQGGETPVVSGTQVASTSQTVTSMNNPSTAKPTPIVPPPSMIANFLSFAWSIFSRLIAWILGR
jgi:hypothetical protein